MDLQGNLGEALGLSPLAHWKPKQSTPEWAKNICIRYRQTIFKSVMKLKPGQQVNWRNYGRCIGLIERCKTFYTDEVPKLLKREGLDRLTKEQQAKLDAIFGEEEMREYLLKVAGRSQDDPITTEELAVFLCQKQNEQMERHRQVAFFHVANQDVKKANLFWKGVSEGFLIFLDEDGQFRGDDRRANVCGALLGYQYEVEKMRRMLPAKTRVDLRDGLKNFSDFQDGGQAWFNDICRDIKLSMKGRGAPHKISRHKTYQ